MNEPWEWNAMFHRDLHYPVYGNIISQGQHGQQQEMCDDVINTAAVKEEVDNSSEEINDIPITVPCPPGVASRRSGYSQQIPLLYQPTQHLFDLYGQNVTHSVKTEEGLQNNAQNMTDVLGTLPSPYMVQDSSYIGSNINQQFAWPANYNHSRSLGNYTDMSPYMVQDSSYTGSNINQQFAWPANYNHSRSLGNYTQSDISLINDGFSKDLHEHGVRFKKQKCHKDDAKRIKKCKGSGVNETELQVSSIEDINSWSLIEVAQGESNSNHIRTIFNHEGKDISSIAHQFLLAEKQQCEQLAAITFTDPVAYIYNPLVYAFETHLDFIRKFCTSEKPVLFLGMNPGPFGMSQNGVPFGDADNVNNWLCIQGQVNTPTREHPKRPILGLSCHRKEVSGSRLWGLFRQICRLPENFFRHCFIHNLCPLAFMQASGKNVTPPQLPAAQLTRLNSVCDEAMLEIVRLLKVKVIVAIGKFVQTRTVKTLRQAGMTEVRVEMIMHPSPINPAANKGWENIAWQQLTEIGVMEYLVPR